MSVLLSMNEKEFAARVAANVKTKQWLNETVQVNGRPVGIKAHGLWIQRMAWDGLCDGAEFLTQKAMKEWIILHLRAKS